MTTATVTTMGDTRLAAALAGMFLAPGPFEWPEMDELGPDFAGTPGAARAILDAVRARDGWTLAQQLAAGAPDDDDPHLAAAMWAASYDRCSWPLRDVARTFGVAMHRAAALLAIVGGVVGAGPQSFRDGLRDVAVAIDAAEPG